MSSSLLKNNRTSLRRYVSTQAESDRPFFSFFKHQKKVFHYYNVAFSVILAYGVFESFRNINMKTNEIAIVKKPYKEP
jgi:hypothetical protein